MSWIIIVKIILLIGNLFVCFVYFVNPLFFVLKFNYKVYFLKNKNVPTNINQSRKTCFIHPSSLIIVINAILIITVLIYDYVYH